MQINLKYLILFFLILMFIKPIMATMPVADIETWHRLNKQYLRMGEELTELKAQSSYLEQQLDALQHLKDDQYKWSNAQELIDRLGENMQKSNAIAYSAADIDKYFKNMFPGYKAPRNYGDQYQNIIDTMQNTLNNTLQTLGMNAKDFQEENKRLAFLQIQSKSAIGQTQAIQVATQIASEQVSQLQLLRQTVMSQATAQTAYYAAQTQKEASAKAEFSQIIINGNTTIGRLDSNPLKEPNFSQ